MRKTVVFVTAAVLAGCSGQKARDGGNDDQPIIVANGGTTDPLVRAAKAGGAGKGSTITTNSTIQDHYYVKETGKRGGCLDFDAGTFVPPSNTKSWSARFYSTSGPGEFTVSSGDNNQVDLPSGASPGSTSGTLAENIGFDHVDLTIDAHGPITVPENPTGSQVTIHYCQNCAACKK